MNVAPYIGVRMIDNFMSEIRYSPVRMMFVRNERGTGFNRILRKLVQHVARARFDYSGLDAAFALQHSDHDGLAFECAGSRKMLGQLRPLRLMHVLCLAAYERLIHFNLTSERGFVVLMHEHPQPVEHEPSR